MQQKIKIWLFFFFLWIFWLFSNSAQAESLLSKEAFLSQLQEMGFNLHQLQTAKQLSRYDLTKLLNAVECQDCIQPSEKLRQTYSFNFWNDFIQLPGKDFRDIFYQKTNYRGQDYYYCVAYVGDQNYMRGYPLATSPLCWGNFCGARSVSKGEFYQTLVNLLAKRLAPNYQIPRKDIKIWLGKHESTSYQYRIFDSKERQLINEQKQKSAPAQNANELHLYLKYCMFNLRQCGFRRFDQLQEGVWPVSQLNILLNENIITPEETSQISSPISPKEALDKLYLVYALHTQCDFNSDYDCDGIKNHQDNCVETYNPNQWDLDNDGKGDVCDEDIDGDGKKNPVWIVDATGRINYRLQKQQKSEDESPLGLGNQDFYAFIEILQLPEQAPYRIKAKLLSNQKLKNIERDFWDGTSKKQDLAQHSYASPGKYTLRAKFQTPEGETKTIFNQLFIGDPQSMRFALGFKAITIEGNQASIQAESFGAIEEYQRSNFASESKKTTPSLQTFQTQLNPEKKNTITLKAYHQGQLVAVATTDLLYADGRWQNVLLQSTPLLKKKGEKIWFQVRLLNLSLRDILKNDRDFGDEQQQSTSQLSTSHSYQEAGSYAIVQKTELKNGQNLVNIQSFRIQNPQEEKSYAINSKANPEFQQQFTLLLENFNQQGEIPELTLKLGKQEQLKKQNFNGKGESFHTFLTQGGQSKVSIKALIGNGIVLESEGLIFLSTATLEGRKFHQDTTQLFKNLKCDLDKDDIPDLYDDDIDGDGVKNLLGLVQFEKEDCSLTLGENVNSNLYRQHFGVCSLDNCPFIANPEQSDLNANGIGDRCEIGHCWDGNIDDGETCTTCPEDVGECTSICGDGKADEGETCKSCPEDVPQCVKETTSCWDGKIDENETCFSCPQDVGACSSICGNGKAEGGETCKNCSEDVPQCQDLKKCWNWSLDYGEACDDGILNGKNKKCTLTCQLFDPLQPLCGNGKIDQGETCKNCAKDVQRCISSCGNGKIEKHLWEECDNGKQNGKNWSCSAICKLIQPSEPFCGNGKIDKGETCQNCAKDVQRCISSCGNGKIESHLGEECDNGKQNGKNWSCSAICTFNDLCGNGKVDPDETCNTCPHDVKVCDKDGDGIPDVLDDCVDIPEDKNGIQDTDGCPEITPPCEDKTKCPLITPECNACPCQYADFSNTLHKNDQVRAKLWDLPSKSHYNYSAFERMLKFLEE